MEDLLSQVFTPLVVQSGLICLGAQVLLHGIFAFALPKGPWTNLPSFTAHQVVCLPLMIYISYEGFKAWFGEGYDLADAGSNARIFQVAPRGSHIAQVVFGELLFWDIPLGLLTPALQDTLMLAHHIGMLFVSGIVVGVFSGGHPVGSYYASFFFGVIEFSTVFLSFVDIFHPKQKAWFQWLEQNKGSLGNTLRSVNELCRVLFALSYLVLRTFYFPYVTFSVCLQDFWKASELPQDERHGASSISLQAVCVFCLLFTFLQIYWGFLVSRQVTKAVGLLPDKKRKKKA